MCNPLPYWEENQISEQNGKIRIYVACLATDNNGILHGRWIDSTQAVIHIIEFGAMGLVSALVHSLRLWREGFKGTGFAVQFEL